MRLFLILSGVAFIGVAFLLAAAFGWIPEAIGGTVFVVAALAMIVFAVRGIGKQTPPDAPDRS